MCPPRKRFLSRLSYLSLIFPSIRFKKILNPPVDDSCLDFTPEELGSLSFHKGKNTEVCGIRFWF
jgi:hypothetical protein